MERFLLLETPIGPLTVAADERAVTRIAFGDARRTGACASSADDAVATTAADGSLSVASVRPSAEPTLSEPLSAGPVGPAAVVAETAAKAPAGTAIPSGGAADAAEAAGAAVSAVPAGETFGEGAFCPLSDAPPLLRQAARELEEYFAGTRRTFDFPLAPAGTPFQRRVWEVLRTIPYGETRTYGAIAAAAGNAHAARAVGMANNRNPIAIVIPCHRVVGAGGALTGYAGGLDRKSFLLRLERRTKSQK